MRILVIEDEPDLREFLVRALREAGWTAHDVGTAERALRALSASTYDLVLLDVGLPDIDGFDLCRHLRAGGDLTPILLLTARNAVDDRVRGLDAGADDYLPKPFALAELLARIRALSRRPAPAQDTRLRCGDLTLDVEAHRVERDGRPLALSAREFALLELLLRQKPRVLPRARIVAALWDGQAEPATNAVEVLVSRLRRKVDVAGRPPLIHTVRGIGYAASDAPAANPVVDVAR